MRKIIALALLALNLALIPGVIGLDGASTYAQFLPIDSENYSDVFVNAEGDSAIEKSTSITFSILRIVQYIVAAIVVLLGIVAAVQMISANGEEENFEKAKKSITYSIVGLAIIALSGEISRILDLSNGGLLGGRAEIIKRAQIFDDNVRVLITFVKYIIGAVAVLILARSGIHMATAGSNEEAVSNDKKSIAGVAIGLVALVFIDTLIRRVFYVTDNPFEGPAPDISQGLREAAGFTNLIVSFAAPIAILSLVGGAVMYAVSAGNDETQEKAKKMMIASLIGIIMIYGAFGLVSTFIVGRF
jgi:hypothetical protein